MDQMKTVEKKSALEGADPIAESVAELLLLSDELARRSRKVMIKRCLDQLTMLIQQILTNLRLQVPPRGSQSRFLNIGCGSDLMEGFLNIDTLPRLGTWARSAVQSWRRQGIYRIDLRVFDPQLEDFANGVLLHHVLEHLEPRQGLEGLRNVLRYLRSGGVLRLSVPSYGAYFSSFSLNNPQSYQCQNIAINSLFYSWGHRHIYNASTLRDVLMHVGFQDVCEHRFSEGPMGEFDSMERQYESIYMTGRKA